MDYTEVGWLRGIYLEDSWVLDITARPGVLIIEVEFVLTPDHPAYQPAPPDKQHCYRRGTLQFHAVTDLRWSGQGRPPARDASGELDYGNIDTMTINGEFVKLSGDFGDIELRAESGEVRLRQH